MKLELVWSYLGRNWDSPVKRYLIREWQEAYARPSMGKTKSKQSWWQRMKGRVKWYKREKARARIKEIRRQLGNLKTAGLRAINRAYNEIVAIGIETKDRTIQREIARHKRELKAAGQRIVLEGKHIDWEKSHESKLKGRNLARVAEILHRMGESEAKARPAPRAIIGGVETGLFGPEIKRTVSQSHRLAAKGMQLKDLAEELTKSPESTLPQHHPAYVRVPGAKGPAGMSTHDLRELTGIGVRSIGWTKPVDPASQAFLAPFREELGKRVARAELAMEREALGRQ